MWELVKPMHVTFLLFTSWIASSFSADPGMIISKEVLQNTSNTSFLQHQHPNSVLRTSSPTPETTSSAPPEFIIHPNDSFIIRNKNVKLTCSVIRSVKAYFVCNGEAMGVSEFHSEKDRLNEWNENEKTLSLIVNRISVEEFFGTYICHCDAWYERGKVSSRNATVEMAYLRKEFEVPPYSQNVELGSQIQLNCHPPKGIPTPRIYWLKDRVEVQPERDSNYIQAADGHLIIIQAREKDRANYTCVAENVANRRLSPPARLGVHVSGGWSDWSSWSSCSGKCGSSFIGRTRKCDNPSPRWGGPECNGLYIQKNKCTHHVLCPVIEPSWGSWSIWSACSPDCIRVRTRKCSGSEESCRGGKDRVFVGCNEGKCRDKRTFFGASSTANDSAQEIVETDLSLLVGLSVAIVVFLVITLISIKFLRRKGTGRGGSSMFSMTNLSYGGTVKSEFMKKDHSDCAYSEDPDVVVTFKASDKGKFSEFRCPTRGSSSNAFSITDDETTHLTKLCYDSIQSTPYSDKKLLLQGNNKILPGDGSLGTPKASPVINTRVNPRFLHLQQQLEDEHQYDIPFGHINNSNLRPPPEMPPPPAPGDTSLLWNQDPSLLQPRIVQGFEDDEALDESPIISSSSSSPCSLSNSRNLESFSINGRSSISSSGMLDPDLFTFSSVTSNGSVISLENLGITLTIPEGALDKGYNEEIFLTLMSEGRDRPRLSSCQTLLSPVILTGPPRLSFKKPVILSFGHCANRRKDINTWELGVYHCDSLFSDDNEDSSSGEPKYPWVKLATLGRESISSPIITVVESETVHIMTDFLTRFCIVGQSALSAPRSASKKFDVFVLCKPVSSNLDYSLVIFFVDKNRASLASRLQWARKRNYGLLKSDSFLFHDCGKGLRLHINDLSMGWSFKCKSSSTLSFDSLWSNNMSRDDKICMSYSLNRLDPLIKTVSFNIILKQESEELLIPIHFEADSRYPSPISSTENTIKSQRPSFRLPSGIKRRLSSALDASESWKNLTKELGLDKFDRFFSSRSPSPGETVLSLWECLEDDAVSREGKVSKLMNFLRNTGRDDLAEVLEKEYGPWI
ncbi:netrin receptor UNC5C [Lepeophtheirus salmonis]|uniref:netrin receptor UNC5C n=1 Tax=Lepeophtheirus salmonis TaxID=72036 RepID=UPI001AE6DC9F|nr:netrin receptor UNC5C-like isoform X1 [Lepeophtheirus salmonis]